MLFDKPRLLLIWDWNKKALEETIDDLKKKKEKSYFNWNPYDLHFVFCATFNFYSSESFLLFCYNCIKISFEIF